MRKGLIEKTYEWDLSAPPSQLWPLLSDTARLNEALDLPRYSISETFDSESLRRRYGEMIEDESRVRWEEPPFEWVENGWWRWRRFYDDGPLSETGGVLMLVPGQKGGTHMHYTLSVDPRGAMGRMLVASGYVKQAARGFRKFTHEVDAFCRKPMGDFYSNYSAKTEKATPKPLPKVKGKEAELLTQFAQWLAVAPFADRVDLRSKRLARCLGVSHSEAFQACLTAVKSGDLVMRYRAVCPVCRASAIEVAELKKIAALLACRGCGAGYQRDLSNSIEVLFSVAGLSYSEATYCGSGPSSSRHVAVQQNLGAMERRDLEHIFSAGVYVARAIDGPVSATFSAEQSTGAHVRLTDTEIVVLPLQGSTVIENHTKRPYAITVERCDWPDDALPVSEALAERALLDLLPAESLPDGDSASIGDGVILGIADLAKPLSTAHTATVIETEEGYVGLLAGSLERAVSLAEAIRKEHPEARFALDFGPLTIAMLSGRMRHIGTVPETAKSMCLGGHRGVVVVSPRMKDALKSRGIGEPKALIDAG